MTCHLARPIARALAAAILPGSIALVLLSSAVSLVQGADSAIAASTADVARDADRPSGPATTTPTQQNRARQSAFDPLAARIKYLHDRLRITPAQEPLWANLARVMQENANSMALLLKERFQTLKSGNAIDSISTYEKLGEAQLDGLKRFTAAFQALYNSLSDDQKKIADDIFRSSLLRTVGSIPQLPGQLVTPAPYAYYPPSPTIPAYPAYPYYPPYSYYPYYNSLVLGPFIGLGPSFFFHRHHPGFLPFRPTVRVGVPPLRPGIPPMRLGVPPMRLGVPPMRLGVPPVRPGIPSGRAAAMQFHGR